MSKTTEPEREMQCDRRGSNTCGMIRQRLQWRHIVTLPECDQCWKLGGPMSVSAARWREDYCRKAVATVAAKDPRTVNIHAVLTVMGKHMPGDAAAKKLEQIAVRVGEKQALVLAAKYGGGELVERIAAMFEELDPIQRAGELAPVQRWLWLYWEGVPMPKRPFIAARAAWNAFGQAMEGLRGTGCGCVKKAKDAVRAVARATKAVAG